MLKKLFGLLAISILLSQALFAQHYERYKKLSDTTLISTHLGFEKKISITVPVEWQKETKNTFPLIIVFDRQNKRSHNYILQTIDYLTSNEQIPSSIIISVESEQRFRYIETLHQISDTAGRAMENEKFIFEELIPLAETAFNASRLRILIGHSRYGYFTTSVFCLRINDLTAVISMSPFFSQKNSDLTDSLGKLNNQALKHKKYYRFGIGNDYPDDYAKMDSTISMSVNNPLLNTKGYHFKQADHNATPGLLIGTALYDIFEDWSASQSKYISNNQKDILVKSSLDNEILRNYGVQLNFSLGILNGKGWYFYNEKQYDKAIQAWKILVHTYPNFSEGYLQILDAQIQLKQEHQETVKDFRRSLAMSEFYTAQQKEDLKKELAEMTK